MAIDLTDLTEHDLEELQKKAKAEIQARKDKERDDIIAQIKELGLVNDVLKVLTRRRIVVPKYRHPEIPTQTWTGIGRKPKWVQELELEGKELVIL